MKPNVATRRKLVLSNCNSRCTFDPDRIGDRFAAAHSVFEAGGSIDNLTRDLRAIGIECSRSGVYRHLSHLSEFEQSEDAELPETESARDIDIVEAALRKAWANRRHWKPSLADTIRLIQLKHELTGGKEYDPLMAAMDEALDLADQPIDPTQAEEAPGLTPEQEI